MQRSKKIHEVISIVFSAPFIALYVVLRVFFLYEFSIEQLIALVVGYILIPLLVPLIYSYKKNIEWDYPVREERIIPFTFVLLGYFFALMVLYMLNTYNEGIFLAMAYTLNGFVSFMISLKYKISIHVIGVMGPATYLLLIGLVYDFIALFILSILVSYSRYALNRHTPVQLLLGYVESIVITVLAYNIVYA
ncbi:MAG: hypothetical protein J7L82_03605 [Staphylothermus sp.]|nr:hypothetical protein [Staphylothermus sp.]